jgi:Cation transporter/ATPase, N-terminus
MTGSNADDIDPVWHALPVVQVLRHFSLDTQQGLTDGQARQGQAQHGPNERTARGAPDRRSPAAGGPSRTHRRVGAGVQVGRTGARCHRPGRPSLHGVFRHPCHRRPFACRRRGHRHPYRGGPHRRPDRTRQGAEDTAGVAPGAVRPRPGGGGARPVCAGGAAGPVARVAAGRGADGGHQPDGLDGARRPAGGDDDCAGCRHAAHGRPAPHMARVHAGRPRGCHGWGPGCPSWPTARPAPRA